MMAQRRQESWAGLGDFQEDCAAEKAQQVQGKKKKCAEDRPCLGVGFAEVWHIL